MHWRKQKGNGVDVSLTSKNINKTLKWTTGLIFNYNLNKTSAYFGSQANKVATILGGGSTISPIVGKPLYAIAAYKWGVLDAQGNPQGYLNGNLSTDYIAMSNEAYEKGVEGNIRYIGPANPTYYGSLNNSLSWKGFFLSANIAYRLGYYFRKPTLSYDALFNSGEGINDFEKRWKNVGDELITNVPSMIGINNPLFQGRDAFYANSEINVYKAGNIRLQYINLGYSVTKIKKLPIESLTLTANMANLGILWRANEEGLDPDYPYALTPSRQISLGLSARF